MKHLCCGFEIISDMLQARRAVVVCAEFADTARMIRQMKISCFALAATAIICVAPARADTQMTCARAMTLEHNNPGIETASIVSIIEAQWQAMDQGTIAHGYSPIAPAMMNGSTYFDMMSEQCAENPGQNLHAAAGQVYRQARLAIDGF